MKFRWEPDLVYLDVDGKLPDDLYSKVAQVLRTTGLNLEVMRIDRTLHGYHVILQIDERLEPWQTLALQAILGSDWRREALNFYRLFNSPGTEAHRMHWNILYERKLYAKTKKR